MSPSEEEREPNPEQIAAYLDGEYEHLGGLSAERVERWLKSHPEALAQVRAQHRLARLWQKTSPDEPAPEAWQRVLAGIERDLDHPARPRPRPWGWWGIGVGLFLTAAACLAVAVLTARRPPEGAPPRPDVPDQPVARAVLPVVDDDEVEILSVRGDDVASLVVGVLPLQGLMVLADRGEVSLIRGDPSAADMGDGKPPMVRPSPAAEAKFRPTAP